MELIIANTLMSCFLIYSLYQWFKNRNKMKMGATHHFISHFAIVLFFLISLNLFVYKGFALPMLLSLAYLVQHVSKENARLIGTNKWTPSLKDAEV